jgi:hypothetical protein
LGGGSNRVKKDLGAPRTGTNQWNDWYNYTILAAAGAGFNNQGRKTLAHPEYHLIQSWWHPTNNLGKLPGDFTHGTRSFIWMRCRGCKYKCGTHHEWMVKVKDLISNVSRRGGYIVCPSCESKGGFCECQSVANHPKLFREWHPDNPPAREVAKNSDGQYLWLCLADRGHPFYEACCFGRSMSNSGCPGCGREGSRTTGYPVVSRGRPDLAAEWDPTRNNKLPSQVTLGNHYRAWWVCSSNTMHDPWQAMVYSRALRGTGCPACERSTTSPRSFGAVQNQESW